MKIKLMSIDEYEKYKNVVPRCNISWWLRSSGSISNCVASVCGSDGAFTNGNFVSSDFVGVRPIIKCNDNEKVSFCGGEMIYTYIESCVVTVGEKVIINNHNFTCIDKNLYIATVPIDFDKFDDNTNIYKNSYIKRKLKKWLDN